VRAARVYSVAVGSEAWCVRIDIAAARATVNPFAVAELPALRDEEKILV
jgi:hypothetical protein